MYEEHADFINELGYIALGSRFRRLADRLTIQAAEVYRARQIPFEPRWFPLFRLILERGAVSVSDAANSLGLTHAAVSQTANIMKKKGILQSRADSADERRRLLSVTEKGKALAADLRTVWSDIEEADRQLAEECGVDLLLVLETFEHELEQERLSDRVRKLSRARELKKLRIVPLNGSLVAFFEQLNREWLEELFHVEDIDKELFADPVSTIVEPGGQVFFALLPDTAGEEQVVGTCALLKDASRNRYELVKMAVTKKYRGRGIGQRLLETALDWVKETGAVEVILLSNSRLKTALELYRRAGFRVSRLGPHPRYERVDIEMSLSLGTPAEQV